MTVCVFDEPHNLSRLIPSYLTRMQVGKYVFGNPWYIRVCFIFRRFDTADKYGLMHFPTGGRGLAGYRRQFGCRV